jgi:hypothetical protein
MTASVSPKTAPKLGHDPVLVARGRRRSFPASIETVHGFPERPKTP